LALYDLLKTKSSSFASKLLARLIGVVVWCCLALARSWMDAITLSRYFWLIDIANIGNDGRIEHDNSKSKLDLQPHKMDCDQSWTSCSEGRLHTVSGSYFIAAHLADPSFLWMLQWRNW
jgi:hypothetical protein